MKRIQSDQQRRHSRHYGAVIVKFEQISRIVYFEKVNASWKES